MMYSSYKNLAGRILGLGSAVLAITGAVLLSPWIASAETIRQPVDTPFTITTSSQTVIVEFVAPASGFVYDAGAELSGDLSNVTTGTSGTGVALCEIDGSHNPSSCHYASNSPQYVTAQGTYAFDFTQNPLQVVQGTHYFFQFDLVRVAGGSNIGKMYGSQATTTVFWGTSGTTTAFCASATCPAGMVVPAFFLATSPLNIDVATLYPAATSTAVSLPTAQAFCGGEVFSTTTGFLDATAQAFSRGLCLAGAFLFVPSSTALNQWVSLKDTLSTKIPFSYAYGVQGVFNDLHASTTDNLTGVTFTLPAIGSTSPLGTLYPTTIVGLSTSTIGTYLPESVRQGFLALQRVFLWAGLALLMYRRIIPHHVLSNTHV